MFLSQLRSSFPSFKGAHGAPRDWCFKMFDVKVAKEHWGGRGTGGLAFYIQQSFTSWIPLRNAGLQLGDRTMEWAIYGWLLTTPALRPPYCKQVFYESACCLFPPTFGVSIFCFRTRVKKIKTAQTMTAPNHMPQFYTRLRNRSPLQLDDEYLPCYDWASFYWALNHRSRRISTARTFKLPWRASKGMTVPQLREYKLI